MGKTRPSHYASMICLTLAILAGILMLRVVLTNSFGYMGDSWKGSGDADHGGMSASFRIEGDATALISPGTSAPIDLRFTNPHDTTMTVSHLIVKVSKLVTPSATRDHPCTMDDFDLTQLGRSVEIVLPPDATTGLGSLKIPEDKWPRVGMLYRPVNQDGCRGAKLTLNYSAFGALGT